MNRKTHRYLSLSALLLLFIFASLPVQAKEDQQRIPKAPEFTHNEAASWINSKPLKLADLKGKVVLLDIWTGQVACSLFWRDS